MDDRALPNQQDIVDREHLKLLAIFYYVEGAFTIFFSSIGFVHFGFGMAILLNPEVFTDHGEPAPPFVGYLLAILGGTFIAVGWTIGGLTIFAARCIQRRKRWLFTLVMAGVNCMFFFCGTVLGVCTIVVLSRESVRNLYNRLPGAPTSDLPS
jgi:hypothetical protein